MAGSRPALLMLLALGLLGAAAAAHGRGEDRDDKKLVLGVRLTMSDTYDKACALRVDKFNPVREWVSKSMADMLDRVYVKARIKAGVLDCYATADEYGVGGQTTISVVLKLSVRSKKDSTDLNTLVEGLLADGDLCTYGGVRCAAHQVSCFEVKRLYKVPEGLKLTSFRHRSEPHDVADDEEERDQPYAGMPVWTRRQRRKNVLGMIADTAKQLMESSAVVPLDDEDEDTSYAAGVAAVPARAMARQPYNPADDAALWSGGDGYGYAARRFASKTAR